MRFISKFDKDNRKEFEKNMEDAKVFLIGVVIISIILVIVFGVYFICYGERWTK